jgi:hypothetical protein
MCFSEFGMALARVTQKGALEVRVAKRSESGHFIFDDFPSLLCLLYMNGKQMDKLFSSYSSLDHAVTGFCQFTVSFKYLPQDHDRTGDKKTLEKGFW